MAPGDRYRDQEDSSVPSLLWLFCSQTTLRTFLSRSPCGGQWPGWRWGAIRHLAMGKLSVWGNVTAKCIGLQCFLGKGWSPPADDPDGQTGATADLAQDKKQLLNDPETEDT